MAWMRACLRGSEIFNIDGFSAFLINPSPNVPELKKLIFWFSQL
jgi:hypothetical protein